MDSETQNMTSNHLKTVNAFILIYLLNIIYSKNSSGKFRHNKSGIFPSPDPEMAKRGEKKVVCVHIIGK